MNVEREERTGYIANETNVGIETECKTQRRS